MDAREVMNLIKEEKEKQKVSTCELARQVGVSKSNVSYWLKGGGITLEKAGLALKALGLSVVIGKEDHNAKAKNIRARS